MGQELSEDALATTCNAEGDPRSQARVMSQSITDTNEDNVSRESEAEPSSMTDLQILKSTSSPVLPHEVPEPGFPDYAMLQRVTDETIPLAGQVTSISTSAVEDMVPSESAVEPSGNGDPEMLQDNPSSGSADEGQNSDILQNQASSGSTGEQQEPELPANSTLQTFLEQQIDAIQHTVPNPSSSEMLM